MLIDPPYFNQDGDKKVFQEYTTTKVDSAFISRLSDYMEDLDNAGIPFLMTNTYCKTVENNFSSWRLDKVPTKYIVGGKSEREGCKFAQMDIRVMLVQAGRVFLRRVHPSETRISFHCPLAEVCCVRWKSQFRSMF